MAQARQWSLTVLIQACLKCLMKTTNQILRPSILIRLRQALKTALKHMIQMSLTFTSVVLIHMVLSQPYRVQTST